MGPLLIIVGAGVVTSGAAAFATSIYLHRGLAHRAIRFHSLADHVFRIMIWLMVGVSRREWVAVHRKHHTFTDVPGDPHSPLLEGFWRIQFGNFFYYLREAARPDVIKTWASDLPPDRWDRWIYDRYWIGVVVGTGIMMFLLGGWAAGLAASAVHAVLLTLVIAPLVNGLTHWYGEQPNPNTARNIRWLVWVTAGESLHNNHHARPRSPTMRMRPGEYDPSWWLIRGLEAMRLVTVRRDETGPTAQA